MLPLKAIITKNELIEIMNFLSVKRPIFHSEGDFQYSFAREIEIKYKDIKIRCDWRRIIGSKEIWIDLTLFDNNGNETFIEIKYISKQYKGVVNGELFECKSQGGHTEGRYNFLKDIKRIEELNAKGFAVFLTNDDKYWDYLKYAGVIDKEFLLKEGYTFKKDVSYNWKSECKTYKKKDPIKFKNDYKINWLSFGELNSCSYRYTLIEINNG